MKVYLNYYNGHRFSTLKISDLEDTEDFPVTERRTEQNVHRAHLSELRCTHFSVESRLKYGMFVVK
jgi:hypothetical protein